MIAQKIAYNVIVSGIAKVLSITLALFGIGMLAHYLGADGFGKYTLTLAFFGFFGAISDLGLHAITTREISRKGANEELILSKIFTLRLIASISILFAATIFVWFLPYPIDVRIAILIIAAAFVFGSSYGFLNGLFQKHLAMDRVALAELIGKVIQMITIVILVTFDLGFIFSAIAILLAMINDFVLIWFFSRRFVHITLSFDPAYWKTFIKESLPMGVSAIAIFLYFKVDTILLSVLQDTTATGIYGAAYKIIETLIFFPAMVIGLVLPLISRYIFTEHDVFLHIANTTLKLFLILIIPMVIGLTFLAPEIINLIGGNEFTASVPVLRILSFTLIGIFFGQLYINILIAANLQRKLMALLIVAAFFNIAANLFFIPIYSYIGAAGVSVATEIFVALASLSLVLIYTDYSIHVPHIFALLFAGFVMFCTIYFLTFPSFIVAGIAFIVYAFLILIMRVVTIEELRSIRPSTR